MKHRNLIPRALVLGLILLAGSCSLPLFEDTQSNKTTNTLINLNPDPNGEPWMAGGLTEPKSGSRGIGGSTPTWAPQVSLSTLPSRVDNSANQYFRPIFNQADGSCAQASGVGYLYTYEMARVRGLNASLPANQFPTHFTYNFLNGGYGANGSWYWDGWEIIKNFGIPTSDVYGGMSADAREWKSGYNLYKAAMANNLVGYSRIDVSTAEGLSNLKQYLAHHGDQSPQGGLAVFAAGAVSTYIAPDHPYTKLLPAGTPEAGKYIITKWAETVNHAMTFVGYDDTVKFDVNGDGQYTNDLDINGDNLVNLRDWEIGALIVVNSWGTSWGNEGRSYMAYHLLAESQPWVGDGGVYANEVYVVQTSAQPYSPKTTLKVTVSETKRNRLLIKFGINPDLNATAPSEVKIYNSLYYNGGEFPINGISTSPVEFAFDITSLTSALPPGTPYKAFVIASERDWDNTATGTLISMSLIDHEKGDRVFAASQSNLSIGNNSDTTLSVVKNDNAGYSSVYSNMKIRGTFNAWGSLAMTKIGDFTWKAVINFPGSTGNAFKFDVNGDWKTNFGDTNKDMIADPSGADIVAGLGAGEYTVLFNDQTSSYSFTKAALSGSASLYFHLNGSQDYAKIIGLPTKLSLNGTVIQTPFIQSPYYGSSLPNVLLYNLDAGTYTLSLDSVVEGVTYKGTSTFTLTTAAKDHSATIEVAATAAVLKKNFPQLSIRGNMNSWGKTPMALTTDYTWSVELTFPAGTPGQFKFDVNGDWSYNWGDNNADGWSEQNGGNITVPGGYTYRIEFRDNSKSYQISQL